MSDNKKRLARLAITPELLLQAVTVGHHVMIYEALKDTAIPSDAVLIFAAVNQHGDLEMTLRSAEFDPVADEAEIPLLDGVVCCQDEAAFDLMRRCRLELGLPE